jgi:hypothetical protein
MRYGIQPGQLDLGRLRMIWTYETRKDPGKKTDRKSQKNEQFA